MMFYLEVILMISLTILCQYQTHAARRLDSIADILGEPHDELHELVVLDQIENYIRPIESLETRSHKSLNGFWSFCLDPANEGHRSRWFEKSLRDECLPRGNFFKMPVPSAFNDIASNKTVKNYMGWMWYQTQLRWPQPGVGGRQAEPIHSWMLQMESINYLSVIWLQTIDQYDNKAHIVGSHAGGHLPITLDLSDILNDIGMIRNGTVQVANIRLTIAVSNMLTSQTIPSGRMLNETEAVGRPYLRFEPDFDFFHFAGIMGDVNLFALAASYIADVHEISVASSLTQMGLTLSGPLGEPMQVCWSTSSVSSSIESSMDLINNGDLDCLALEKGTSSYTIPIRNTPTNWYSLLIILMSPSTNERAKVYDMMQLRVAVNKLASASLNSATGPVAACHCQLQGFGMHHEQLFSGRSMSLAAIMKDLNLVKQMGANIVRTSHYPYSQTYLDACDELGLMVIAECPAVGLNSFSDIKLKLHKQILREMMERDHRHPSIKMWSLANEPESQLVEARNYFAQLVAYARTDLKRFTVDARRPLTAAIAQSHVADKIGQFLDVIMVNRYYGWYDCTALIECVRHSLVASLEGWARKYPGKPLIISEFGADTLAGFHSSTSEIFSEEYQRDLLVAYEQVFDELALEVSSGLEKNGTNINFIGSMIWNFADFSTHESLMRPGGNRKGVFTRWREPKLAAESIKQIYTARRHCYGPVDTRCVIAP